MKFLCINSSSFKCEVLAHCVFPAFYSVNLEKNNCQSFKSLHKCSRLVLFSDHVGVYVLTKDYSQSGCLVMEKLNFEFTEIVAADFPVIVPVSSDKEVRLEELLD